MDISYVAYKEYYSRIKQNEVWLCITRTIQGYNHHYSYTDSTTLLPHSRQNGDCNNDTVHIFIETVIIQQPDSTRTLLGSLDKKKGWRGFIKYECEQET